jgi:hypothetical protein
MISIIKDLFLKQPVNGALIRIFFSIAAAEADEHRAI